MPPEQFFHAVKSRLQSHAPFGEITLRTESADGAGHPRLACTAVGTAASAAYRLQLGTDGKLWVSLVTPDRWLSQSIEQDLVHTGDKLEDLLDEELTDLHRNFPNAASPSGTRPIFEHFRSEDLLFTFRSPLPLDPAALDERAADTAALWLLAYEATFRRLGDMEVSEDEQ